MGVCKSSCFAFEMISKQNLSIVYIQKSAEILTLHDSKAYGQSHIYDKESDVSPIYLTLPCCLGGFLYAFMRIELHDIAILDGPFRL